MRRVDESDLPLEVRTISGPLFARNLFAASGCAPSGDERAVAEIIGRHEGRRRPVTIAEISAMTGFDARRVKGIVERLVCEHGIRIGGSREEPAGYFLVVDAEDVEAAARPFRHQVMSMFRRLRVLESRVALREFLGQLRLEVTDEAEEGHVQAACRAVDAGPAGD